MQGLSGTDPECAKSEGGVEAVRYDTSIYDTPFSKLPEPKRVWLGSPSSALEGLGLPVSPHESKQRIDCF